MKKSITIPVVLALAMISLIAVQADDAPVAPGTPVAPVVAAPSAVELTIQLTDNSRIIGSPMDLSALPLKLEFTKLDIPLHLLTQAEFTANRAALAVKFRNSDTLTGNLELERIRLKTSYGEATIPVARIAKITFVIPAAKP